MTRGGRGTVLIGVLCWAAACVPVKRAAVAPPSPPPVDWGARIAEADTLYAKGHYAALKEARSIYEEALAIPEERAAVAEKVVRAAIAFELREKELGVLAVKPALDLAGLVSAEPSLAPYPSWLELLAGLPNKVKGNPGIDRIDGRTLEAQLDWVNARVTDLDKELGERAPTDDLAAALRLALRAAFFYKFQEKLAPTLRRPPSSSS